MKCVDLIGGKFEDEVPQGAVVFTQHMNLIMFSLEMFAAKSQASCETSSEPRHPF